eukprot:GHVS01025143.1.p1 GENE.GHVS01025143.1~~GHVS01025143.1.p1  ORF type:complete len:297 (+),score=65.42 GHVS01025143.1:226-1116(+)
MSKRPLLQQQQDHEQQPATNNGTSHTSFKRIRLLSATTNGPTAQQTPAAIQPTTTTDTHITPYTYPTTRKRKASSDSLFLPDTKQLRRLPSPDPPPVPMLPLVATTSTTSTSFPLDPHFYVPQCSTTVSPIDQSSNNVHPQQRQIPTYCPPGFIPPADGVVVVPCPSCSSPSGPFLSLPSSTTWPLPCVSSIVPYKHHFDWWMNVLRASDAQKEWLGSNRHLVTKLIEDMIAAGGSAAVPEFPQTSIDTLSRIWREHREQPAEADIVGTDGSRISEVMDDEHGDVRGEDDEGMCVE